MPELPEVEAARVLVAGHCLNRKIESATVASDDSAPWLAADLNSAIRLILNRLQRAVIAKPFIHSGLTAGTLALRRGD